MTLSDVDLTSPAQLDDSLLKISDCEDIASYNWIQENVPTILIPGMQNPFSNVWCLPLHNQKMNLTLAKGKPPAWTPPVSPIKLREDNGSYFRDPNAARYPNHPIEPAVRAIFACQPDFRGYEIDLFACSRTLGDLLRFVRGVDKSFRILVEAVGNTVFFVRRENSPTELIPDVRGYGHSFPEAYTTWGSNVKKSESHQRIVGYQFA